MRLGSGMHRVRRLAQSESEESDPSAILTTRGLYISLLELCFIFTPRERHQQVGKHGEDVGIKLQPTPSSL